MTDEVKPQQVRAQLARLSAAEPFASSPQLVSFLDYVVNQALAGRGGALKGYTIAVEALGRPVEFDPQTDPIVRVEARRLRQALRTYYNAAGKHDPIRISMPTGGYVPVFAPAPQRPVDVAPADIVESSEEADDEAADAIEPESAATPDDAAADAPSSSPAGIVDATRTPSRRWMTLLGALALIAALATGLGLRDVWERAALSNRMAAGHGADQKATRLPTIRVQSFEAVGEDPPVGIARRVAERLAASLARYDEVRIIGPAAPASPQDIGDYLLRGRLTRRPDGGFGLGVALLAPVTREVLLPRDYPMFHPDEIATGAAGAIAETQVVRALTIEIAQPGGFISADQIARLAGETSDEGRCLYAAQSYWRQPTRESHARARACLKGVAGAALPPALVQAHLAMLALDEYRNDYSPEPGPPALDRALQHAQAAIAAAPSSPRAQQALMDALFVRGQTEPAIEAGQRAIQLNPFDMDILADYGARLVQTERPREGREKLLEAAASLPIRPPWHDFYLVLSAALIDDRTAEQSHADAIVSESDPLSLIARILAAKDRGATDQAEALGRRLVTIDPRYRTEPRALLARRAMSPPVLDLLTAAIESATRAGRS